MLRCLFLVLAKTVDAKLPLAPYHLALAHPPDPTVEFKSLPENFSWRRVPGFGSVLTASMNQHVPVYCGACFAFGSFHVLADRVKIARLLYEVSGESLFSGPDLVAAIQVMLNCGKDTAGSCATGGSAPGVFKWVREFGGIPAAGCQPYLASDAFDCSPENVCRNCMPSNETHTECWAVPAGDDNNNVGFGHQCVDDKTTCAVSPYPRITVDDFGKLPRADVVGAKAATKAIMLEVARAGPVTCDVDAAALVDWRSPGQSNPGVIVDPIGNRSADTIDHVIEVVGWGVDEEEEVPYWEIRNSWGEYWGDNGFARIRRGHNDMFIEQQCHWVHAGGWGVPSGDWQPHDGATTEVSALLMKLRIIISNDHHQFSSLEVTLILVAIATLLNIVLSRLIISRKRKNTNQGFQHVDNDGA